MNLVVLCGCSQKETQNYENLTKEQLLKMSGAQLELMPEKMWNQFSTDELVHKFYDAQIAGMPLSQWNRLSIAQLQNMSGWQWRYAPRDMSDKLTKKQWLKMNESQLWYGASDELWKSFTKKELMYLKKHQFKNWPQDKFEERFQVKI